MKTSSRVHARLGPKVLLPGVPKQSDYDLWLECRNCGSQYKKYETRKSGTGTKSNERTYERSKRKGSEGREKTQASGLEEGIILG